MGIVQIWWKDVTNSLPVAAIVYHLLANKQVLRQTSHLSDQQREEGGYSDTTAKGGTHST